MICSFSGHKLATAAQILQHYLELDDTMAREAGSKQVAWLAANSIRIE